MGSGTGGLKVAGWLRSRLNSTNHDRVTQIKAVRIRVTVLSCDSGDIQWFNGLAVIKFELTVWEALDEESAVGFGEESGIEDHDAAGVVAVSNQSSEALFELNNGFRGLVVAEGIAAAAADEFESSFEEWVIGDAEGEFGDDDILKCITGNVDTLPEAVGTEEHGADIGAESFKHS